METVYVVAGIDVPKAMLAVVVGVVEPQEIRWKRQRFGTTKGAEPDFRISGHLPLVTHLFSEEASLRSALHFQQRDVVGDRLADPRKGLRGQGEVEGMEQQSKIWFRLGVTRPNQTAAISGWQHHIEHLNRAQLFQYGARREPRRMRSEMMFQHYDPAGGEKRDQDVGLHTGFPLMKKGANAEIAF